jgi:hypothetical protein
MDLVLNDIANWKSQLAGEIIKIDEQITHLKASRKVAVQKISEAGQILEAHDFTPEAEEVTEEVEEATTEAVTKAATS